jgi:carbamoyl-phosphate synthase small subunit
MAKLALSDGTVYTGRSFGAVAETGGEVVFNTSMTGYQEVLTDPSYTGQIVTMTYPHIGNYGITDEDNESPKPHVAGFIVREVTHQPSSFRSQISLPDYLAKYGIVGIHGIDTRSLVRRLRVRGAMPGVLSSVDMDDRSLVAKALALPGMEGADMVRKVTPETGYVWDKAGLAPLAVSMMPKSGGNHRVVALDYGMKWNIPRCLVQAGCEVTILPGTAKAEDVLALNPDGVFLSNGPGDPAVLGYAIETVQGLIGKKPIFGICLGHQLLGLALGAKTFKLKFGHRGANQPVLDETTGKVEITSQNHGFAVDPDTLPPGAERTHINLNDRTLEGFRFAAKKLFCVQYHPESSAGPHDSAHLFEEFRRLMGS